MKDSLSRLFQQRFQGHEAPVDTGIWEGIQQQLTQAVPVDGDDGVGKLFKERFQGHEVAVDPAIWSSISSQLGHTGAVGTTAGTAWMGWAAAGVVAIAVATVALMNTGTSAPEPVVSVPTATTETPVNEESTAKTATVPTIEPVQVAAKPTAQQPKVQTPLVIAMEDSGRSQDDPPVSAPAPLIPSNSPSAAVVQPIPAPKVAEVRSGEAIVESIIQEMTQETQWDVLSTPEKNTPKEPEVVPVSEPEMEVTEELPLPKLFMPNTFTPNGDGVNDEYEVGGAMAFQQVIIRVSSLKTGQTVFSTNSNDPWRGEGCEDGMYLVALEARTLDGRTVTEGKVVWLNRNPMN